LGADDGHFVFVTPPPPPPAAVSTVVFRVCDTAVFLLSHPAVRPSTRFPPDTFSRRGGQRFFFPLTKAVVCWWGFWVFVCGFFFFLVFFFWVFLVGFEPTFDRASMRK